VNFSVAVRILWKAVRLAWTSTHIPVGAILVGAL